jgi:hypothetical protein
MGRSEARKLLHGPLGPYEVLDTVDQDVRDDNKGESEPDLEGCG